ncbi:MAG: dihydropteroate synthase [Verrucomicrobiales bacterium]
MIFQARQHQFSFPRPALVMGIVNITPDSFSDGGNYFDPERAIDHALQLVEEGADILDLGGESTRPRALPVDEEEECRRVLPTLEKLMAHGNFVVSVDTQKEGVAIRALKSGAAIINDIAAGESKPKLWEELRKTGAGYIVMHMKGTPQTMQIEPRYENVTLEVNAFFEERVKCLKVAGVQEDQLVLDVGIGFGKTLEHNLQLLGNLGHFRMNKRPMMLGVSRKSFISKLLGVETHERLPAGIACVLWGLEHGVQLIRTHDVKETAQAIRMFEAIRMRENR